MTQPSIWNPGSTSTPPPGTRPAIIEVAAVVPSSVTLGAENNALSVGPLELALGAIVTVPPGRRWVIL